MSIPLRSESFGGRATGRVNSSSRFIPTRYPSSMGAKVRVHITLVGQRILHCLSGKLHPISKDPERARRAMAAAAIRSPDLVNEPPLPIQCGVRRPQRIAFIINVCSFGGRAIELDDLKSLAGSELVIVAISNVVSTDVESRELLTYFVKRGAQFL